MTCSLWSSPCTRSMSSPGVRMVTWNGRPSRRTSSGSSTATVSTLEPGRRPPTRTTGCRRVTRPMRASKQTHPRRRGRTQDDEGVRIVAELSTWLDAVSEELGIADVELDNNSIHTLLDLARDSAHEVER